MPDMMKKYTEEVKPALQSELGYANVMQIPKLVKIVISTGLKSSCERDAFAEAKKHLAAMTGQYCRTTAFTRPMISASRPSMGS